MKRILVFTTLLFFSQFALAKGPAIGGSVGFVAISQPQVAAMDNYFDGCTMRVKTAASFNIAIPAGKWDIGVKFGVQRQSITYANKEWVIARNAFPMTFFLQRNIDVFYLGAEAGYIKGMQFAGSNNDRVYRGMGNGFVAGGHIGVRPRLSKRSYLDIQSGCTYASTKTDYTAYDIRPSMKANYLIYTLSVGVLVRM